MSFLSRFPGSFGKCLLFFIFSRLIRQAFSQNNRPLVMRLAAGAYLPELYSFGNLRQGLRRAEVFQFFAECSLHDRLGFPLFHDQHMQKAESEQPPPGCKYSDLSKLIRPSELNAGCVTFCFW